MARSRRKKRDPINGDIHYDQVRLIDHDGEMRGFVPIDVALDRAADQGMDLVLVSDNPQNPVTRIMDYSKYQFELSKREAKNKQKKVNVKEVQLKLTTEEHDVNVKVRNAHRFLRKGDRVRVVIRFRGREITYPEQGYDIMEDFAEACAGLGKIDKAPAIEGRNMIMYLAPLSEQEKKEYQEALAEAEEV